MLWKIGNVELVMTGQNESIPIFSAKINTLNSTDTTIHYFGYGNREVSFTGKVVGEYKKSTLENLLYSGNLVTIYGPNYSGNIFIDSYNIRRDDAIGQTIDITEPCDSPVYTFSITGIEK